jgi:hypothetical protein
LSIVDSGLQARNTVLAIVLGCLLFTAGCSGGGGGGTTEHHKKHTPTATATSTGVPTRTATATKTATATATATATNTATSTRTATATLTATNTATSTRTATATATSTRTATATATTTATPTATATATATQSATATLTATATATPTSTQTATPTATATAPALVSGVLEGGITPIVGAEVNLMKIGTTGYGSDPGNDVGSSITDSHGNYSIGMPPCSPSHEVWYLSAEGGNTGSGINSLSRLIAVLGPCNQAPSGVTINEVTTVASTFAMSQFMNTTANLGQNIGAPSTNLLGAANASLTVRNLVNLATGAAPGSTLPTGATAPTAEINTLANALATCVQANDSAAAPCHQLNCVATPGGVWNGTSCNVTPVPETTVDAMLQIARNPANNIGALFALATSTNYSPVLGSAPNDWTLGLKFVGGGLNSNFGLAVDGGGSVWVVNFGGPSLSKFSPFGVALSPGAGFTGGGLNEPRNVAIDSFGNAWVTAGNSVAEFDNNGNALSPMTGYTGGGTNDTYGIAIDSKDRVWASNLGAADISLFCGAIIANCPADFTTGEPISPDGGFTGGGLSFSFGAAVDGDDSVWTVNDGPSDTPTPNVSKFSSAGTAISGASGFTGGGLAKPTGVAIDPAGNAWACNIDNGVVSEFSKTGSPVSGSGFTGGGVGNSEAIAVDSANNVWVANESSPIGTVSEFNSAGTAISPSGGFQGGSMNDPLGIAIDASGNVWVSNDFDASVTQLIGAASPVKTPLIGLPTLP